MLFQTTESSDIFYAALKIILGQVASLAEVTKQAPLHSSDLDIGHSVEFQKQV